MFSSEVVHDLNFNFMKHHIVAGLTQDGFVGLAVFLRGVTPAMVQFEEVVERGLKVVGIGLAVFVPVPLAMLPYLVAATVADDAIKFFLIHVDDLVLETHSFLPTQLPLYSNTRLRATSRTYFLGDRTHPHGSCKSRSSGCAAPSTALSWGPTPAA